MQQVRQSVQVADSLLDVYRDAMNRFKAAWAQKKHDEMELARGEIERVYSGIWENLDAAAARTRSLGRSTDSYDAVRRDPRLVVGAAIANVSERVTSIDYGIRSTTYTHELTIKHNGEGLLLASQAASALKAAWPEVDWTPPETPEVDLRPRGLLSRLFGRR